MTSPEADGFLDVLGGMADWPSDWPSSKLQTPSSRKIPNSKAQVRGIKNAKFKMSKLPDAASILAFLIFNLLILNWLRGSFWGLGFGAFLELGAWNLELPASLRPTVEGPEKVAVRAKTALFFALFAPFFRKGCDDGHFLAFRLLISGM